jgi:K(+)-stimulated pyrophosphate-energized sodium pump
MLTLAIVAGAAAVLYGVLQTLSLLRSSPGNARMQEIAAAIRRGRRPTSRSSTRHRRRRRGHPDRGFFLLGPLPAVGFLIGSVLSGLAGFAGMLISSRQRPDRPGGSEGLAKGLSLAFRSGAITGMLVAGFALLGVAGYYYILTGVLGHENTSR